MRFPEGFPGYRHFSTRFQLSDATSPLLGGRFTDWKRDRKSLTFASDNMAQWNSVYYVYELLNDAPNEGIEIELNGELTPGWQFSSGYTYSETTNQYGDRIMTCIPRNAVKLFTSYRLPGSWNKLILVGGFNNVGLLKKNSGSPPKGRVIAENQKE